MLCLFFAVPWYGLCFQHFLDLYLKEKVWSYFYMVSIDLKCVNETYEPRHEISNNVVCATNKASDQPAHMRSLIRGFASRLNNLGV